MERNPKYWKLEQTLADDAGNSVTRQAGIFSDKMKAYGTMMEANKLQMDKAEELPEGITVSNEIVADNGTRHGSGYQTHGRRPYRRNPEYGALRDMMLRKYGSILGYALAVGKNSRTIGRKLLLPDDELKVKWGEDDIITACEALNIPQEDIGRLFFPYLPTAAELEKRNNQTIEDGEKP